MLIIGLTGGIGMGKSTAAQILRRFGLPVYDADHVIHGLLKKRGKAVRPVAKLFPEAYKRGAIDRKILGQLVFRDPKKLRKLEKILHPLARQEEKIFLQRARKTGICAAILEIPLLFETGGQKRCDVTLCVTAPGAVRKSRVLKRPGMNQTRLKAISERQMSDREKRKLADYVIHTGRGYADTERQIMCALDAIF